MPRNRKNLRQAPALSAELEEYAQLFFKYSVIIEEHADAVRHVPDEVDKAYEKVCREHDERQRNAPRPPSLEDLYQALKYFGGLCENAAPQTVIDHVRLVFYASYCTQAIVHGILPHSERPGHYYSDPHTVLGRGGRLLKEYLSGRPSEIPTVAPRVAKFTSSDPTTRSITDQDIANWKSSPDQLLGKCFISADGVRRTFYIDDFSIKRRKGAQFEILYEDLGLDEVQTLDPDTLFEMLSEAQTELVTDVVYRPS